MRAALIVVCIAGLLAGPAIGQERRQGSPPDGQRREAAPPQAPRRLPADTVTRHTVEIRGTRVDLAATAGAIVIDDQEGRPQAEIGYVAYAREGVPREGRPVVFALNGGPGASSAWLHLGAMGPWRIDLARSIASPSALPQLLPNAESWADVADLVFIDPPGTGFSALASGDRELRERWWSVDGDIELLASFIRRWLTREGRLASPKIIVGESYGGFRAPRIARALQQSHGIAVRGLVLVSPVLDFGWRVGERTSPLPWIVALPPMAATHLSATGRPVSRSDLADVEAYARGDMAADLLAPRGDGRATARLVERVTAATGLDRALVERLRGRVEPWVFQSERQRGRVASGYDGTITGQHPNPDQWAARFTDPILDTLTPALTSAMLELMGPRLNWRPDRRYETLNRAVGGGWQWGRSLSPPTAMPDLQGALALDPRLDVVVIHGLTDLVTSYFASALIIDQIPPEIAAERVRLVTVEGGHMFYDRAQSRAAFRTEFIRLLERVGR